MLQIVSGSSWSRYFTITDDDGNLVGNSNWTVEFGITDLVSGLPYFVGTNTNITVSWPQVGTVILELSPQQTQINATNVGWYLDLIDGTTRLSVAQGLGMIISSAPVLAQLQNNTAPSYLLVPNQSLAAPTF